MSALAIAGRPREGTAEGLAIAGILASLVLLLGPGVHSVSEVREFPAEQ